MAWKKIGSGNGTIHGFLVEINIYEDTADSVTTQNVKIINEILLTEGEKDKLYLPIMSQSLEISLLSNSVTNRMIAADKNKIYVDYLVDSVSLFKGYIQSEFNNYVWYRDKRVESFFCTSIINKLKTIPYLNPFDYTGGIQTLIEHLQDLTFLSGIEQDVYCATSVAEDGAAGTNPSNEIRHDLGAYGYIDDIKDHYELLKQLLRDYHLQFFYYNDSFYFIDRSIHDAVIALDKIRASDNAIVTSTLLTTKSIPFTHKPGKSLATRSKNLSSVVINRGFEQRGGATFFIEDDEFSQQDGTWELTGDVNYVSGANELRVNAKGKTVNYAFQKPGLIFRDGDSIKIDFDVDGFLSSSAPDGGYTVDFAEVKEIDIATGSVVSTTTISYSFSTIGQQGQEIPFAGSYTKLVTGDPKLFSIRLFMDNSGADELDYVDFNSILPTGNGIKNNGGTYIRKTIATSSNALGEVQDWESRLNSYDQTMMAPYVTGLPSFYSDIPIEYYDGTSWDYARSFDGGDSFQEYVSKLTLSAQDDIRDGIIAHTTVQTFFIMLYTLDYNIGTGTKRYIPSYREFNIGAKPKHVIEMYEQNYSDLQITTSVSYEPE